MARLVLVGLPGVGKSTVASALAASWGCAALDTDDELAAMTGGTAAEVLRRDGIAAFRQQEVAALRAALHADAVVATGGGVVTLSEARELLRHEVTLWLDCEDDVLIPRLVDGDRPLLGDDPRSALEALRREREEWYREVSSARIDASGTPDETVERVRDALAEVAR